MRSEALGGLQGRAALAALDRGLGDYGVKPR
jgi:hypothetical protein